MRLAYLMGFVYQVGAQTRQSVGIDAGLCVFLRTSWHDTPKFANIVYQVLLTRLFVY